jgi:hypothetical protein
LLYLLFLSFFFFLFSFLSFLFFFFFAKKAFGEVRKDPFCVWGQVAATLARDLSWAAPFELLLTFLIKPNFPSFV